MDAERKVGQPWTAHEDALLSQAVSNYGGNTDWKAIALQVPGRTNKACRKRWLHSLCPSIKKSAWTKDEDDTLLALYQLHGTKWSLIARQIPGRTDDACSKRYREALDPSLKKDEWTAEEDGQLLSLYAQLGGKWGQVGQEMKRSGLGCRNRWRLLERKRASALRNDSQGQPSSLTTDALEETNTSPNQPSAWNAGLFDISPFWNPQLPPFPSLTANSDHSMEGPSSSGHASPPPAPPFSNAEDSVQIRTPSPISIPYEPYPYDQEFEGFDSSEMLSTANFPPLPSSHRSEELSPIPADVLGHNINRQPLSRDDERRIHSDLSSTQHPPPFANRPPSPTYHPTGLTYVAHDHDSLQHITSSPTTPPTEHLAPTITFADVVQIITNASMSRSSPSPTPQFPQVSDQTAQLPRLSSQLPTSTDPTVLGYACGHVNCWSDGSSSEEPSRFATSKELSDHVRSQHPGDISADSKPYRCGLQGCGKGWKSVNGLQYHLQVSKAHFLQAITQTNISADDDSSRPRKKTYPCTQPHCLHVYKQLSGLRYHLTHGHPAESPVQLHIVPPTLARKMNEKSQRQSAAA
ncbi:hypothetical protein OF83DRAFT_1099918 [Amylostereum chailletii]|nr:hypothetical protein OF83DRAFT_1099918 [Amylostereum chailletii]